MYVSTRTQDRIRTRARLDSRRGVVERRVELEPVADGLLVEADEQDPVIDVQADGEHP